MPYTVGMATRIGPETVARIEACWDEILEAVAGDGQIQVKCAALGVDPSHVRVYRLARPEREKEWQAAREQSADYFAEKIAEIASSDKADHAIARVKLDAYRWLASKRNPRVYSDKQTLDVNVRTIDLTRIIADANARLSAARQQAIEGEVLRQALPAPELDALL